MGPVLCSYLGISESSSEYLYYLVLPPLRGVNYPYIIICYEEVIREIHSHPTRQFPCADFALHILSSASREPFSYFVT